MVESIKWEAFWDAPLYIEGSGKRPPSHATSIPPMDGIFDQPGLPRRPQEVIRATATYESQGCEVKTNGARLEISFPGVKAGVFAGRLQYDVFKGSNLIRQVVIAKTDLPSVAFKYDGGLKGLPIQPASRMVWRDLASRWQENRFGGPVNQAPATVWSSKRLIVAELPGGSIAAFPPPHSFYWARESEQNLGYSWYRKDSASTFSFGLRQAEKEEDPEYLHNFALTSARPGTWQRMPVFLYVSPESGQAAADAALAFTHDDRFKPLPGYQVMGDHYHVSFVRRLRESGGVDNRINDIEAAKAVGINIYGIIDGARGPARGLPAGPGGLLRRRAATVRQELPDHAERGESRRRARRPHGFARVEADVLAAEARPGQPLVEQHPKYGKVYNLGSPADLMEMTKLENALIFVPHPRSKGRRAFRTPSGRHAVLPERELPGARVSLGHGHRRLRDAAVRDSLSGPVGRDEQLDGGLAYASEVLPGHLRDPLEHRRSWQADLRRHLRHVAGQLREARSAADGR